ncbi:RHS repeat-associated core domain-containing protein [Pseudomonas fluorescens]|uniref:RHS repeat-associated core domain-containing protein n=1 Tax=Pseudomonas fluorescens TaxID=294 RepID=A0A5E7CIA0_PSEFL|nr:RHS repeat-associated core domain-containing protein [Pseudomonas fluorescens]VVN99704.1 hypothetical protein PS710_02551 [Pseudomonas fluorescens]
MSAPSMKILCRYQYDPLDRLMGVGLLERASTQRFYQGDHLTTELGEQTQRTIIRHEARPLAQQQSTAGVTDTMLLATDQAHSLLQTIEVTNPQQLAYTAYGHHPAESGLSRLLGFNGECPDAITGHYLLGQGRRAFNPVLMRFNSPDQLSPFGEGGINPYAYCGGDPINFYDPTGYMKIFQLVKNSPTNFTFIERPSVIVKNPLHSIQPSPSTIVRSRRSASTSNPIVDATTPIANAQHRSTSILPPEGPRRERYYVSGKKRSPRQEKSYDHNIRLNESARQYDQYMADNPLSEIRPRHDLEANYRNAVALHSTTQTDFSRVIYTRRMAKKNVVSQLIKTGLLIRDK